MMKLKTYVMPLSLILLSACNFSTSVDLGYSSWYTAFGQACGYTPRPGCNYYYNGAKIMIYQDPFYSGQSWNDYWTSPNGIWYGPGGYAINSQQDQASTDVIGAVAAEEQQMVEQVGKDFAQKYALADDKGIQIATTLRDWAEIGKTRARTEADLNDFVKRLYGVDPARVSKAIESALKHDSSKLLELNTDVAAHWGTTPETSQKILREWYRREITGLGI
ncbi:MAG: hypothetical protein JST80_13190 [Bdellovibrionales bacterium]|nr:hypothetical protein [Bdellovibrionales bacterium]